MRVVVIGGTRFIGPPVVRLLEERGDEVIVFHRGAGCAHERHVHDDRANLAAHSLRADVVIDLYAMTERDAETLVAANLAPRLVVISSADVYRQYGRLTRKEPGPPDPIPLGEDAPLRERLYPYREQAPEYEKIVVERVVGRVGATVLRLPAVYGPGDYQHRFRPWLQPRVTLTEDVARWRWTRGYVENVADAIVLAATDEHATGRTYNVGDPDAPAEAEWARLAGAEVEIDERADGYPDFDWRCHLVTDTSAIRNELGYAERVPRETAVAMTLQWERGA